MTQYIKMNYKNDKKYASDLWRCPEPKCRLQDTNSHLIHCEGYREQREDKDLNNDKDLCQYLQEIFLIRQNYEENDRNK